MVIIDGLPALKLEPFTTNCERQLADHKGSRQQDCGNLPRLPRAQLTIFECHLSAAVCVLQNARNVLVSTTVASPDGYTAKLADLGET